MLDFPDIYRFQGWAVGRGISDRRGALTPGCAEACMTYDGTAVCLCVQHDRQETKLIEHKDIFEITYFKLKILRTHYNENGVFVFLTRFFHNA